MMPPGRSRVARLHGDEIAPIRRGGPVTLIVLAALVLVGCEPEDDPHPTPTVQTLDVTVDAALDMGAATDPAYPPGTRGLVAEYTVTNRSDELILVVERRPDVGIADDEDGAPPDSPESAWVYADDGIVRVSKEMFSVPPDVVLGEPYTVAALPLAPGRSATGRAFAVTPVRTVVPDPETFVGPSPEALPADASAWEFCLQVAPGLENEDLRAGPPRITNYTPDRQLVCSDTAELPPSTLVDGA